MARRTLVLLVALLLTTLVHAQALNSSTGVQVRPKAEIFSGGVYQPCADYRIAEARETGERFRCVSGRWKPEDLPPCTVDPPSGSCQGDPVCQSSAGSVYLCPSTGPNTNLWTAIAGGGGGGSGSVTSVGLTAPGELAVTGSPITLAGTFGLSWVSRNANLVFAGPTSGVAATPAFRSLVPADIPSAVPATRIGGGLVDDIEYSYLDGASSGLQGQLNGKQPLDSDLTGLAALSCANGQVPKWNGTSWTCSADSTGGTPTFDSIASGTNNSASMTCTTGCTIAPAGSGVIRATAFAGSGSTSEAVDLGTSEVSGVTPIANGGTNANTASGARTQLGVAIGTNVQAWDTDLDSLAALSCTAGQIPKRSGGVWTCAADDNSGGGGSGDPVLIDGVAIADAAGVDMVGGTGFVFTLNTGVSPDTATASWAPTELGSFTWGDGTQSTLTRTYDIVGAVNPSYGVSAAGFDFNQNVNVASLSVDDPGEGQRGNTYQDNGTTCASPAAGFTETCTITNEFYVLAPGGTLAASKVLRGGGGDYGEFTCTAGTCALDAGVVDMGTDVGTFTSATFAGRVTDETGTGAVVLAASPALSGNPTLPTAAANDNDTSAANTQYVQAELAAYASDPVTFTNKVFDGNGTGNDLAIRRHATDCTSLTDGVTGELCYEQDADAIYVCEPTAGACDTAAEWRITGAAGSGDVTDVWSCTSGNCNGLTAAAGDTLDAGSADSTAPNKVGTTPPATCTVGQTFFDSDATAGQNHLGCTATNTWTAQGGGGTTTYKYEIVEEFWDYNGPFGVVKYPIGQFGSGTDFDYLNGYADADPATSSSAVGAAYLSAGATANSYIVAWAVSRRPGNDDNTFMRPRKVRDFRVRIDSHPSGGVADIPKRNVIGAYRNATNGTITTISDGIYFLCWPTDNLDGDGTTNTTSCTDTEDCNWWAGYEVADTRTIVNTGSTCTSTSTGLQELRIANDGTTVRWYIGGTEVDMDAGTGGTQGVALTSMPTAAIAGWGALTQTTDTGQNQSYIDWIYYRGTR